MRCPSCHQPYIYGEIVCRGCGEDLDEPITLTCLLPVVGAPSSPSWDEPTIELHIVHAYGDRFAQGQFAAVLPLSRLAVPVRIGRADPRQNPPIQPELDLTQLLEPRRVNAQPHAVSRLHATLQLEQGQPAVKPLSSRANRTWVRHTRGTSILSLVSHQPHRLRHRDILILGSPSGLRVELRVLLREPTQ